MLKVVTNPREQLLGRCEEKVLGNSPSYSIVSDFLFGYSWVFFAAIYLKVTDRREIYRKLSEIVQKFTYLFWNVQVQYFTTSSLMVDLDSSVMRISNMPTLILLSLPFIMLIKIVLPVVSATMSQRCFSVQSSSLVQAW